MDLGDAADAPSTPFPQQHRVAYRYVLWFVQETQTDFRPWSLLIVSITARFRTLGDVVDASTLNDGMDMDDRLVVYRNRVGIMKEQDLRFKLEGSDGRSVNVRGEKDHTLAQFPL